MNHIIALPPRILALLAVSVALSACASMDGLMPSTPQRDAVSLRAEQSLAGITLSEAAWPASDWWHALGDPQLDALVDEALVGNPGLDAADARTRLALAQVDTADAAR